MANKVPLHREDLNIFLIEGSLDDENEMPSYYHLSKVMRDRMHQIAKISNIQLNEQE